MPSSSEVRYEVDHDAYSTRLSWIISLEQIPSRYLELEGFGCLPGEVGVDTAEVAVGGGLLHHGSAAR